MTILIKDLTVKNFMSVGNQTQGVRFDQEQLTLVLGENLDQGGDDSGSRNGTGKTTIINALSYALYGQALTNIKRNNLINKTNSKHMLVTLNFEKNNVSEEILSDDSCSNAETKDACVHWIRLGNSVSFHRGIEHSRYERLQQFNTNAVKGHPAEGSLLLVQTKMKSSILLTGD